MRTSRKNDLLCPFAMRIWLRKSPFHPIGQDCVTCPRLTNHWQGEGFPRWTFTNHYGGGGRKVGGGHIGHMCAGDREWSPDCFWSCCSGFTLLVVSSPAIFLWLLFGPRPMPISHPNSFSSFISLRGTCLFCFKIHCSVFLPDVPKVLFL